MELYIAVVLCQKLKSLQSGNFLEIEVVKVGFLLYSGGRMFEHLIVPREDSVVTPAPSFRLWSAGSSRQVTCWGGSCC